MVKLAPEPMRELIRGLQALRGVAHISAVTIASELGNISARFESARKMMGYCGVFPSEDSSGKRKATRRHHQVRQRSPQTNRVWSNRPGAIDNSCPAPGREKLRKTTLQGVPAEITAIAWKAQNRLHKRYMKLTMAGKDQRKVMTA